MVKRLLLTITITLILAGIYMSAVGADLAHITQCSVDNIKIGDTFDRIYDVLRPKYTIKKTKELDSLKEVAVLKGKKEVMHISLKDNKIFLIDVYALYSTTKNIHPGSKLSAVLSAYGIGKINPTDAGYFVYFEDYPGIQFLINDDDVPEKLRGIPDDVIKEEQEKQILCLKNAKISAIQISCHDQAKE